MKSPPRLSIIYTHLMTEPENLYPFNTGVILKEICLNGYFHHFIKDWVLGQLILKAFFFNKLILLNRVAFPLMRHYLKDDPADPDTSRSDRTIICHIIFLNPSYQRIF